MNAGVRRSFVDCDGRLTNLKPEGLCDCTVTFLLAGFDPTGALGMPRFTNGNVGADLPAPTPPRQASFALVPEPPGSAPVDSSDALGYLARTSMRLSVPSFIQNWCSNAAAACVRINTMNTGFPISWISPKSLET